MSRLWNNDPALTGAYPQRAGWREPETSREAADKIEERGRAQALRDRLQAFFDGGGQSSVHELAAAWALPVATLQPRFSELRAAGKIEPTGERRTNAASGASAHVWRKAGPVITR